MVKTVFLCANFSGKNMKTRFSSLDAIRGIAAMAVMFLHYSGRSGLNWMPRAWMAVDLFFIMSGFVLMHSYSAKISEGKLNFFEFIRIRLIRLMPLYLLGLLLGYFSVIYSCRLPNTTCESSIMPAVAYGMLVLPYFTKIMWPFGIGSIQSPFPLNGPAWSFCFELFVNLVFFIWIVSTKKRHLWLVICVALLSLVAAYHFNGSVNGGWTNSNFYVGFPRVIYHFFIGVLIYTQYQKYGLNSKLIAFISVALFLAVFSVNSSLVSMFTLFILAPFVVLANAKITFKGNFESVCTWLGDISYPLYITHWPIFQLLYLFGHLENLTLPLRVIFMGLIAVMFAWIFSIIDRKVRVILIRKPDAILKAQL
jgi:peptidoglycan/LPS O-acetylase OafA/YrhL